MNIKERSLPITMILFLIPLVNIFYLLYWLYATTTEVNPSSDSDWDPNPILVVIFAIIPVVNVIYLIYWVYKMSKCVFARTNNMDGQSIVFILAVLLLLLPILFFVSLVLLQNELNKLATN